MEVLSALPEHVSAIAEIHVATWKAAYQGIVPEATLAALSVERREEYWRTAIAKGTPQVLIARVANDVAGWIAFGACRDVGAPSDASELQGIYISAEYWSRGVGQALWLSARQRLIKQHYRTVSLWVLADNQRAIRFYRAAGFQLEASSSKEITMSGKVLREDRYIAALDG
ncbi:MAG: GNAT family N-acetyltransferase [Pseudoxanthomonas sp.]